jgi:soluble lytic murein transglycosylase
VDAVRFERWSEAATAIDSLPEAQRTTPEIRYVRGRAALALGDHGRAVVLLADLDRLLPLLARDILRRRAEAMAVVGPYAEAAAHFSQSVTAADLLRAAEAYEKAADQVNARLTAERAVTAAQRSRKRIDEANARLVRARLHEAAGKPQLAVADLRWIATEAPGGAVAREAAGALERLKVTLTGKERFQAVLAMIDGGSPDAALAQIDRMASQPGFARADILHARAMALYKSRNFPSAADAFLVAAKASPARAPEALYQAARALSRAGRDDDALVRLREVVTRYRKSPWAERAASLTGRIHLLNGRYKAAADAYTSYFATFRKGEGRDDAEYEMALALLSSGSAQSARRKFAALASRQKNRDEQGKLRQLEGVAALRAGDRAAALSTWAGVVQTYPLSWAALTARARLMAESAGVPPLIEPSIARPAAPLLVTLPPDVAFLTSLGLDADAENVLASSEQTAASSYAGRESEALCRMYGMLAHAKRRYRVGSAAVSFTTLLRAPSDAERWAWDCVYPRPYADHVRKLEEEHGLPAGLVHALMRQESAFDHVVVSPASAVGLMQLIPSTAEQAAREISLTDYDPSMLTNPDVNLRLGAFYIGKLLKTFQGSGPLAAAAYNAGPRAVSQWLLAKADNDVDLWVARIPYDETRNYVARVMGNLARYQWLSAGDAAVMPLSLKLPDDARAPEDAY